MQHNTSIILIILYFGFNLNLIAQDKSQEHSNDKKILQLIDLVDAYTQDKEFDSLQYVVFDLYDLAQSVGSAKQKAIAEMNLGYYYGFNAKYDSSQVYYLKAIEHFESLGEDYLLAKTYREFSTVLATGYGDFEKASELVIQSIQLLEPIGDSLEIMSSYFNLAYTYSLAGQKDEALEILSRVETFALTISDSTLLFQVYRNKGSIYYDLYEDDKAYEYQLKAKSMGNQDPRFWNNLILSLANTAASIGQFDEALANYTQVEEIYKNSENKVGLIYVYQGLSYLYKLIGDAHKDNAKYDQAVANIQKAYDLAEELELQAQVEASLEGFVMIYKSMDDYRKALEKQTERVSLIQSLNKKRMEDRFAQLKTEFETEKKEAENRQLQAVNTQQAIANRYLIIAAVALGLLVLFLFIFYRRLQRDKAIIEKQSFELQKLNDLKSEFFANISHELRTPLTLAQGNIALLTDEVKGDSQVKHASNARRSLSQLSRMVEDLLDLSKFELGRFKLQLQSMNMATFLKRTTSSFASLAEDRQVSLNFINESATEPFAEIDVRQFEKVVNNILYNAFKFTKPGDTILVTLSQEEGKAVVSVSDTGRGISSEDLPNIFHRFYQANNHDHQVGSGLGLAIVKEIVDLHHGSIEVESEEGRGTQFRIFIDVTASVPIEDEASNVNVNDFIEDKLLNLKTSEPTILLVEDNLEMQDFLVEILGKYFKIEKANNGIEALEKLKEVNPSLIISDVMMPVMDGFTLLEKLKSKGSASSIPFILLTARAASEDRLRGLRLGVDDYITKPFDREELLVRVVNLFENLQHRLRWAAENQDDQTIIQGKVDDEDSELIERLKEFIEFNISNAKLSIPELASVVAMSDRQLYRKTSEICGMTPNQLIMEVRLQTARKLLLSGEIVKLSQLAMEVGIGTPAYLSKMFYQRFGKRPTDYIS